MTRSLNRASNDSDQVAEVLAWTGTPSGGITLAGRIANPDEAKDVQMKLIMSLLLERFRVADIKKNQDVDDFIHLIIGLKKVSVLDKSFEQDLADLIFLAQIIHDLTMLRSNDTYQRATTIKDRVDHTWTHCFHKILFLLPAGRVLLAKLDAGLLQLKTMRSCSSSCVPCTMPSPTPPVLSQFSASVGSGCLPGFSR